MSEAAARYKNHRFPPEIIARAVWLYYRLPWLCRKLEGETRKGFCSFLRGQDFKLFDK